MAIVFDFCLFPTPPDSDIEITCHARVSNSETSTTVLWKIEVNRVKGLKGAKYILSVIKESVHLCLILHINIECTPSIKTLL